MQGHPSTDVHDKGEVTVINGGISIRARRPRHLAPIHYKDATPPPSPHPAPPGTLRSASMQQVRAQPLSCKELYETSLYAHLMLGKLTSTK